MARATAVANYFIKKAAESGRKMMSPDVINLVYIAHGWHLAIKQNPLVDEPVKAWQYGPVFPSLYQSLIPYGGGPITGYAVEPHDERFWPTAPYLEPDEQTKLILDKVWSEYSKYNGPQLIDITHRYDSPWSQVFRMYSSILGNNAIIDNDLIREHFIHKEEKRRSR